MNLFNLDYIEFIILYKQDCWIGIYQIGFNILAD